MDSVGPFIQKTSLCENYFKRRKLTCDSGYGDDDDDDENMNDLTSTFDDIVNNEFDDHLHEIIKHYENVVIQEKKPYKSIETKSLQNEDKSIRKRRVTPIPKQLETFKLSTELLSSHMNQILFVEEEDEKDIKEYHDDDDFICSDINTQKQISSNKKNTWQGISGLDPLEALKIRSVTLKKSKSFDRAQDQKDKIRHRKQRMSIQRSVSQDSGLNENSSSSSSSSSSMPYLEINTNTNNPLADKKQTTCYPFKKMVQDCQKEISTCSIKIIEDESRNENLPTWMREAECDMLTDSSSNDSLQTSPSLSTKLEIPTIDWQKLHETKNRNNELLSNQRKQFMKQKFRDQRQEESSRRRKLTPSESPSKHSLAKLSTLRNSITVFEEAEEEEEEES